MDGPVLEIADLGVRFGAREMLRNLNFEVWAGECLAMIGPNDAEKTVLLKSLLDLVPHTGEIYWDASVGLCTATRRRG